VPNRQRKKSPPPKIVFKNLAFDPLSFYLGPSKENKLHGSKIRDKVFKGVFLDTESTGSALNPKTVCFKDSDPEIFPLIPIRLWVKILAPPL
jgi:hypothetical protein